MLARFYYSFSFERLTSLFPAPKPAVSRAYSASTNAFRLFRLACQKTRYCSSHESTAFNGSGIELVQTMPSFAPLLHQVGAAQQPQMFGDSRPRHRKRPRDLSRRLTAPPQQVEHGPAGGIGQGVKGGFSRICNRTVPHNA